MSPRSRCWPLVAKSSAVLVGPGAAAARHLPALMEEETMDGLKITTAAPGAESIQRLLADFDRYLADLYPPDSGYGLAVDELQSPNVRFVFVELDDAVVACGALRLDEDYAEIKRMYVVPEQRQTGIGRQLLAHLEAAASSSGRPLLRLETSIAQPEAIALYEQAGFRRRDPFPPYEADPRSVFMEKPVAPIAQTLGRAGSFP
jgi:putative acetyltransferase